MAAIKWRQHPSGNNRASMAESEYRTRAVKMRARERFGPLADGLAMALAASLPWSTSATGILAGLWLIALIPTLDVAVLRRVLSTPAGGLPVLLWVLALVGMLWAIGVPMAERVDGLSSYHKLLTIPLLIAQFQRSDRGRWVMIWFFISCGVMLVVSWALFLVPSLPWPWYGPSSRIGVPVKDYIAQSGEFTACVLLLAAIALDAWRERRHAFSIAMSLLALAFLANIFYISTSRTSLVVIPILLLLFACKRLPWTATAGALFAAVMLSIFAWSLAPEVKNNITDLLSEVRRFQPEGKNTRAGERLEFWRKSIGFIADAPIIGHGTGSIRDQFRHSVVGQIGMAAMAAENPHNQTIAVAIQLGLVGTAALFAMWLAHVLLFRGDGIIAWAGLLLVTQNVVGSLFNSHLFDFTQGWGYVIGVGVAGGMIYKGTATSQSAVL
jgi:O-antigen ligase